MPPAGVGACALGKGPDMLLLMVWAIYPCRCSCRLLSVICALRSCRDPIKNTLLRFARRFLPWGMWGAKSCPNQNYVPCRISARKKKKDRETTRARPTPTPAGSGESRNLRTLETARREVDLSSSYLEDNLKRGLNRSFRPLSCRTNMFVPVFTLSI